MAYDHNLKYDDTSSIGGGVRRARFREMSLRKQLQEAKDQTKIVVVDLEVTRKQLQEAKDKNKIVVGKLEVKLEGCHNKIKSLHRKLDASRGTKVKQRRLLSRSRKALTRPIRNTLKFFGLLR
jgi:predicted  nucleic acid-binding Zn-ribbon protein